MSEHVTVPDHVAFKLHSGKTVNSLAELVEELKLMQNFEFAAYVNETKNDFANWIEHIFNDEEFAEELRKIHSKEQLIQTFEAHLQGDQIVLDTYEEQEYVKPQDPPVVHDSFNPRPPPDIHEQIGHLESHLEHLTTRETAPPKPVNHTFRENAIDFLLGLVVGLVGGFIIAKLLFGV